MLLKNQLFHVDNVCGRWFTYGKTYIYRQLPTKIFLLAVCSFNWFFKRAALQITVFDL